MPRKQLPKHCLHRPSGRGRVILNGQQFYTGPWNTPQAQSEYERLIGEWLANGRQVTAEMRGDILSVSDLIAAYLAYQEPRYVKNEFDRFVSAYGPLRRLYGHTPAADFGPLALETVRNEIIKLGNCRSTIRDKIQRVVRMFRWAGSRELVPSHMYHALKSLEGLRSGEKGVPDSKEIPPVSTEHMAAVLPHVSAQVAAMIQVQSLTGMRPGEVVIMRTCDIDRRGSTWFYEPFQHKTKHRGHQRIVALSPQATLILKPWLCVDDPEAFLFSPADAEEARRRELRRLRKTPVQPSQRNRKRTKPKRRPGERYTTNTYRHAIYRACDAAGIPRWFPNQIRHTVATVLGNECGIEAAQVVLGHRHARVTEVYLERDRKRAAEFVGRLTGPAIEPEARSDRDDGPGYDEICNHGG